VRGAHRTQEHAGHNLGGDGILLDFFGCGAFFLCEGVRSFVSRFFLVWQKSLAMDGGKKKVFDRS
jgi:hypothetical protein